MIGFGIKPILAPHPIRRTAPRGSFCDSKHKKIIIILDIYKICIYINLIKCILAPPLGVGGLLPKSIYHASS